MSGTPTASTSDVASAPADPKSLRQKLEEAKARKPIVAVEKAEVASVVPIADEEIAYTRRPMTIATTEGVPNGTAKAEPEDDKPVPVGPRATRSTTAATAVRSAPIPTGPSAARTHNVASAEDNASANSASKIPNRPAVERQTMPPPTALSIDEERAAARARKFGAISKPLPQAGPPSRSASTAGPEVKAEATAAPAAPSSRPASPLPTSRRSGSVESRPSERVRGVDRAEEDRERDRARRERLQQEGDGDSATTHRNAQVQSMAEVAADAKEHQGGVTDKRERVSIGAESDRPPRRSSREEPRSQEMEPDRGEHKPNGSESSQNGAIDSRHKPRERSRERGLRMDDIKALKTKRDEEVRA